MSRANNTDFTAWFVNSVILSIPILCSILWLILNALSNQIQSDQGGVNTFSVGKILGNIH